MNEVFAAENIFLYVIGIIWVLIASIHDLRKREVANWLSFSLIAVALSYRLFYSALSGNWHFSLFGLIGFAVFFAIANLLYYGRVFAGGDAKLMMALGAVVPFYNSFLENITFFGFFIFIVMFLGGIYGLFYSSWLIFRNKKEFSKEFLFQLKSRKKLAVISMISGVILLIAVFVVGEIMLIIIPALCFLVPLLFSYAKAIENSCMIKSVNVSEISTGEWLVENLIVKGRKIRAGWQGVSEDELEFLRKNYKGKIKIKQGIPFVPSFLIALLFLLWNPLGSFWKFF